MNERPLEAQTCAVPLAVAITALREELTRAWWDGEHRLLRFKPSPVELTLQVAVTSAGKGHARVRWWVIELGGEVSRQSVATQTVKLTLEPKIFDDNTGEPLEFLVDSIDESGTSDVSERAEVNLDAPD